MPSPGVTEKFEGSVRMQGIVPWGLRKRPTNWPLVIVTFRETRRTLSGCANQGDFLKILPTT
jgi:hypothetical protein